MAEKKLLKFHGGGALINENIEGMEIACFNPRYDKINDAEVMLKIPEKQIIINQGTYNSCVGHSVALASSILHYNKTNKWIDYDPYVIYGTRVDGQYSGIGMYANEAIDNCITEGLYLRRDFGQTGERPQIISIVRGFKKAHPELVAQAKEYALTGRATVYNAADVRRSLMVGMPVSATWRIYSSFMNTGSDGRTPIPAIGESYLGNHQMTIIGIKSDNTYIVANSYGESYGFKGIYYIPAAYNFAQGFAISDTIIPMKTKAKEIHCWIGNNKVLIDGKETTSDVCPTIINDRTMVPIRIITEALGASVEWIESTQTVIIRSEEAVITMNIGDSKYKVDRLTKILDSPPIIIDDRTFLPIRFISENLNCSIEWIQDNQEVIIRCL